MSELIPKESVQLTVLREPLEFFMSLIPERGRRDVSTLEVSPKRITKKTPPPSPPIKTKIFKGLIMTVVAQVSLLVRPIYHGQREEED